MLEKTNDASSTDTEGIESRFGADCSVCLASEAEGLQHQLNNFFPNVALVDGVIKAIDTVEDEELPKEFILEDQGRLLMLDFWNEICEACNKCRGCEDPRMRDHFTDSLGIFLSRTFKLYINVISHKVCN